MHNCCYCVIGIIEQLSILHKFRLCTICVFVLLELLYNCHFCINSVLWNLHFPQIYMGGGHLNICFKSLLCLETTGTCTLWIKSLSLITIYQSLFLCNLMTEIFDLKLWIWSDQKLKVLNYKGLQRLKRKGLNVTWN